MDQTLSSLNSLAPSTGKHNLVLGKSSSKHIQGFLMPGENPTPHKALSQSHHGFSQDRISLFFPLAQRVVSLPSGFSQHSEVVVTQMLKHSFTAEVLHLKVLRVQIVGCLKSSKSEKHRGQLTSSERKAI